MTNAPTFIESNQDSNLCALWGCFETSCDTNQVFQNSLNLSLMNWQRIEICQTEWTNFAACLVLLQWQVKVDQNRKICSIHCKSIAEFLIWVKIFMWWKYTSQFPVSLVICAPMERERLIYMKPSEQILQLKSARNYEPLFMQLPCLQYKRNSKISWKYKGIIDSVTIDFWHVQRVCLEKKSGY